MGGKQRMGPDRSTWAGFVGAAVALRWGHPDLLTGNDTKIGAGGRYGIEMILIITASGICSAVALFIPSRAPGV